MKSIVILLKFILLLTIFSSSIANAEKCGTGGPITFSTSPAFPAQFSLTGKQNGDVLWSGSFVVTFTNSCKFAGTTGGKKIYVAVSTGGTTGTDLLDVNGANSGLMVRQATTSAILGNSGSCSSSVTASTDSSNRTVASFCAIFGAIPWPSLNGTTVTFPGVSITVKNKDAVSTTLSNDKVISSPTSLVTIPWGLAKSGSFPTFDLSGPDTAVPQFPQSQVVRATCTLSPKDITVNLPSVSSAALSTAGATAGITPFQINLVGCTNGGAAFLVKTSWAFVSGASTTSIVNSAAVPAGNVETQILNSDYVPISNSGTVDIGPIPSGGGSISKSFFARYIANGVASPGSVKGVATYTLVYQ